MFRRGQRGVWRDELQVETGDDEEPERKWGRRGVVE